MANAHWTHAWNHRSHVGCINRNLTSLFTKLNPRSRFRDVPTGVLYDVVHSRCQHGRHTIATDVSRESLPVIVTTAIRSEDSTRDSRTVVPSVGVPTSGPADDSTTIGARSPA